MAPIKSHWRVVYREEEHLYLDHKECFKLNIKNKRRSLYLTNYGATGITIAFTNFSNCNIHCTINIEVKNGFLIVISQHITFKTWTYEPLADFHFQAMTRSHHTFWGTKDPFSKPVHQTFLINFTFIIIKLLNPNTILKIIISIGSF